MSKLCCICFFGAMRTLPQTIDSIKEVIQQFKELYDVKIFVHTWKGQEFKLLEPDYYRTTDQEEQFKNLKVPEYTTEENIKKKYLEKMTEEEKIQHEDRLKGKKTKINAYYVTTKYATYSRKQVTLLALSKIPNPELVVFIRPDILFKTINIPSLLKRFNRNLKRIQIITPDFDSTYWNKELGLIKGDPSNKRGGVNDRFAICLGPLAAKIYGSQYDHIDDLEKERIFVVGETILEWVFNHYNVINIRSRMCFYLLRSDGKKHGWCKEDLEKIK